MQLHLDKSWGGSPLKAGQGLGAQDGAFTSHLMLQCCPMWPLSPQGGKSQLSAKSTTISAAFIWSKQSQSLLGFKGDGKKQIPALDGEGRDGPGHLWKIQSAADSIKVRYLYQKQTFLTIKSKPNKINGQNFTKCSTKGKKIPLHSKKKSSRILTSSQPRSLQKGESVL